MKNNFNQLTVTAIRDLYKTPNSPIYLHEPLFIGNDRKYVLDAIDSTFVSSVGKYVDKFEDMMAEITGTKKAIAVVNGTAALHIALKVIGVKQGDEVISQALTFIATANAISYEKAIPHFVDVDENTMGLSPDALKIRLEAIAVMKDGHCYNKETGNKITACVPMHTFGFPARIDEIVDICNQYNIPVIEDAAESLGSTYKGKHTGTFGQLGTFSFNGNKTVTCGGGGAIVTNDEELGKRIKYITTTAKIPHPWEYAHSEIGYNYRMPNLNAALACAQLEQLNRFVENKRGTAAAYHEFFEQISDINSIKEPENSYANYWLNAIRFKNKESRDSFLQYSNDHQVMTRPIWKLMNGLSMFENCPKGDLSIAESLENTIVNIPSSVRL